MCGRGRVGAWGRGLSRCIIKESRLENCKESCVFVDNDAHVRLLKCVLHSADAALVLNDRAQVEMCECDMRLFQRGAIGQAYSYVYTCASVCACVRVFVCVCVHTQSHTQANKHKQKNKHMHTNANTPTYTDTHSRTHTLTHSLTQTLSLLSHTHTPSFACQANCCATCLTDAFGVCVYDTTDEERY